MDNAGAQLQHATSGKDLGETIGNGAGAMMNVTGDAIGKVMETTGDVFKTLWDVFGIGMKLPGKLMTRVGNFTKDIFNSLKGDSREKEKISQSIISTPEVLIDRVDQWRKKMNLNLNDQPVNFQKIKSFYKSMQKMLDSVPAALTSEQVYAIKNSIDKFYEDSSLNNQALTDTQKEAVQSEMEKLYELLSSKAL